MMKPHAVCVPFSAQGHVSPFMQLVKLLHWKGFNVTMVDTASYHARLVRSLGPDFAEGLAGFRVETIPDGLHQSGRDANPDVSELCDALRKNCSEPFKELIKRMQSSAEDEEGFGAVRCIIADGVMSFAIGVAEELGIPEVQFWTASACGFMAYLQFDALICRGIIPFKDPESVTESALDMLIDWIPGMTNIRLKDMPNFIRTTDLNETMFDFLRTETKNCLKSPAIIINTFHDLESQVLEAMKANFLPNIYAIGPLPFLLRHVPDNHLTSVRPNLRKEDSECLNWLQKWEPGSVLYVNYGNWTVMSDNHLKEFAWGLANSKVPFLWIIRSDVVMGESAILPKEFCDEIKERGYITSWCHQEKVLSHPSVGLFLTHCGWNSMTEALCGGVPMICWPFFAEQQTNCRYACTHWNIGMEVNEDVKWEEVAGLVKEMMDGVKGREAKRQVEEWKKKALEATEIGGSSFNDFNAFIKAALHC
ncbi:linamarin synthase 2-like [Neltuma alba]|uniref:linamarin synthase 2-like n=1 Tax=Neltuma alba TaxID=207710 RepID=UPI0010A324E8|nr:linamarin synthase 2-like [Prosopis alba]